jgi:GNAT superfamily N-acetyltransferase
MSGLTGAFELAGGVGLRLARPSDRGFLFQLFIESRPWLSWVEGSRDFIHALYEQQYEAMTVGQGNVYPEHMDLLIQRVGDPVGRVVVNLGYSHWRIAELQIRSAAQGKGTGSSVVRGLQAAAARAGVPITLSTPLHGLQARQLYERLGFRVSSADRVMSQLIWHPPDRMTGTQNLQAPRISRLA